MIGTYWPYLFAIGIGVGLTVQVGMNSTVGRVLGSPLWAAVANFAVGLAALLACSIVTGTRVSGTTVGHVPSWAWFAGLLGATFVIGTTVLGPRIGALVWQGWPRRGVPASTGAA